MKVISCKDMGASCEWVGRAETLEELRKKCAEHGATEHGMQEMPEELWAKALTLIRDE